MTNCRSLASIPKTCQRCGTTFACGLSCCWCDEVTLDARTRQSLQQRYADCLCRPCLEAAAAQVSSTDSAD